MPAQAVAHPPLSQFCAGIRLSADARALLRDDLEPLAYVRQLHERAFYSEAAHVLARLFTKREAVWWGCQCVRQAWTDAPLPALAEAAIAGAEAWVANPTEEHRQPLFQIAQDAGLHTAAGCAALAAFGSGGSLMPPDFDPVPPKEAMTAELTAAAVLMAGVEENPDAALEKFRIFIEQGIALYEQSVESN